MPSSICFISGRKISTEARLFTTALCRFPVWNDWILVTRCASAAEMIAYQEWSRRVAQIHLVLKTGSCDTISPGQSEIIGRVSAGGGRIIRAEPDDRDRDALVPLIRMCEWIVVMEIDGRHPLLYLQQELPDRSRTVVFQWAVPTDLNAGCAALIASGRALPLYPAHWREQVQDYMAGIIGPAFNSPHQMQLDF